MPLRSHSIDEGAVRRILLDRSEIVAGYLFGSYASGRPHRHSDVDVGVLLRERRGRTALRLPATYEVDLANAIGHAIGHSHVDVVILNRASPLLAWEAVRKGRRLFARSMRTAAAFEIRTRQRFLDTGPLREIQDRYLARIAHRGFSKALAR